MYFIYTLSAFFPKIGIEKNLSFYLFNNNMLFSNLPNFKFYLDYKEI